MKYNIAYITDVPFGGKTIKSGTKIGQLELPEACNPAKIPDQFARGVLAVVPVPVEAEVKKADSGKGGGKGKEG